MYADMDQEGLQLAIMREELNAYTPADSALAGHCRRVAAIACEVAGIMELPPDRRTVLEQACLLHHLPLAELSERVSSAADGKRIGIQDRRWFSKPLLAVLCGYHDQEMLDSLDVAPPALAQIVKMCDLFDQHVEAQPVRELSTDNDILDQLKALADTGILYSRSADALETLVASQRNVRFPERLPGTLGSAREVICTLAHRPTPSHSELHDLASSDPILAAEVVRVANSALYSPVSCLRTLAQCIRFIGPAVTRRVLLSAALRPPSILPELRVIWKHSLEVSVWCECTARQTGLVDPDEAMLAGLLHDMGRIAIHCLPQSGVYARLDSGGCPAAYLETLLFGEDHGEIGSRILEEWRVSPSQATAIQMHHRPERSGSQLASLLYLAEQWTAGVQEDLPSDVRLQTAMERTGLTASQLDALPIKDQSPLISILAA